MQCSPPETDEIKNGGFLNKSTELLKKGFLKPTIWVFVAIFLVTVIIGYWLGTTLVISQNVNKTIFPKTMDKSKARVITLLEVTDLTDDQPQLLSIWFVFLTPGSQPRLGFTPIASPALVDNPNNHLLKEFSLDKDRNPSADFINSLRKFHIKSNGYVVLDQMGAAAFINWFSGKDINQPLALENHSMTEYGQILRGMCNTFPQISEKGISEFPWSRFLPDHINVSLPMSQVMDNINFLTTAIPPQCEMVPLP